MGERRLARLSDRFPLKVERVFTEIHPDTPAQGSPISSLGYPPERWAQMMESLARMGSQEDIVFAERTITINSHKALLLAEAAREHDPDRFEELNERLFRGYFSEVQNLGDEEVLRRIASEAGIKGDTVDRAWSDPSYEEKLETQQRMAAAIGVTGIPTFVVGEKYVLEGAVPLELLIHAATEALKDP